MIYEAILSSSQTDLELFYEMRGEEIIISEIMYELGYIYKFTKEKWIAERAVRRTRKYIFARKN
jgi:hypothetical protein